MFLHEFGEDFVLALQLLFQQGDPPVLVVAGAAGAVLECDSGVLEELLLPTVEHRGVNAVLVAQIRHRVCSRRWSRSMATFSGALKRFRVFLDMGKPPLEIVAYSSALFFPFRLRQNNHSISCLPAGVSFRGAVGVCVVLLRSVMELLDRGKQPLSVAVLPVRHVPLL